MLNSRQEIDELRNIALQHPELAVVSPVVEKASEETTPTIPTPPSPWVLEGEDFPATPIEEDEDGDLEAVALGGHRSEEGSAMVEDQ